MEQSNDYIITGEAVQRMKLAIDTIESEYEKLKGNYATLQTKYDNILATESGHESKTENVWQSGYASGHKAATEKAATLRTKCDELQKDNERLKAALSTYHGVGVRAEKMGHALYEIQRLATAGIFTHIKPESVGAANCIPIEKLAREALEQQEGEKEQKSGN